MNEKKREERQKSDLLVVTGTSFLDSIQGLKVEDNDPEKEAKHVLRRIFLPIALHLTDIGHDFGENSHTPQGLISEILKYKEDLSLPPEFVAQVDEKFVKADVPWIDEAEKISDPMILHPLKQLRTAVKARMSTDASIALAKLSF